LTKFSTITGVFSARESSVTSSRWVPRSPGDESAASLAVSGILNSRVTEDFLACLGQHQRQALLAFRYQRLLDRRVVDEGFGLLGRIVYRSTSTP
jgi:hypothetical protein